MGPHPGTQGDALPKGTKTSVNLPGFKAGDAFEHVPCAGGEETWLPARRGAGSLT